MFFARYFPGLGVTVDELRAQTPEETCAMRRVGEKMLKREGEERLSHTRVIAASAGMKVRF